MDVIIRKKILDFILTCNAEMTDYKMKLLVISNTTKPHLKRMRLFTALREVEAVEKELRERVEKLKRVISNRSSLLIGKGVYGEVIEKNGKLFAVKDTISTKPISHFSCSDLNRGYVTFNQITVDIKKRMITGVVLKKLCLKSGDVTSIGITQSFES